jgi:hypothetical protein
MAKLMHHIYHGLHVFHGRMLQDTMPEIEDMTGSPFGATQNIVDTLFDF